MTEVFVPDYWPRFTSSELRRFDYTAIDDSMPGITSVFSYDQSSDSMLYVDYDTHLTWKDTWYYKFADGDLIEWRDDYPGKYVVMSEPIRWGGRVQLYTDYITKPKMSLLQSWPPAISSGIQIVHYENQLATFKTTHGDKYRDVLVFTYMQAWDSKPGGGARYWMAKGVGPVAVQWLAQDPKNPYSKPIIQTARMDAVVSSVMGAIS